MTPFLLSVIAILVGVMGWGSRQAFNWAKEAWGKHVTGEELFRKSVEDKMTTLEKGIEMFFQEIPPLKTAMGKIPEIEKKVDHIERDVVLIKGKFKIK